MKPIRVTSLDKSFDRSLFGGKASVLARLHKHGFPVPASFCLDWDSASELVKRDRGRNSELDAALEDLAKQARGARLAVRSSANIEDGSLDSFAGIFSSQLDVAPEAAALVDAVHSCFDALRSAKLERYADARSVDLMAGVRLAILVQVMIEPVVAGVLFTQVQAATRDVTMIEAVAGLGDNLVAGRIRPQRYLVHSMAVSERVDDEGGSPLLTERPLEELTRLGQQVAEFLQAPQDIEWALDRTGKFWLLQSRPITASFDIQPGVHHQQGATWRGYGAAKGQASGRPIVVDEDSIDSFPQGAVLVARYTDTDFLPAMRRAAAIVTEEGGLLSHAAIVARELQLPCVVALSHATQELPSYERVFVSGTSGLVTLTPLVDGQEGEQVFDLTSLYYFDTALLHTVGDSSVLLEASWSTTIAHRSDAPLSSDMKRSLDKHLGSGMWTERQGAKLAIYHGYRRRLRTDPVFRSWLFEMQRDVLALDASGLEGNLTGMARHSAALVKVAGDAGSDFVLRAAALSSANGLYLLANVLIPEGYGSLAVLTATHDFMQAHHLHLEDLMASDSDTLPAEIAAAMALYRVLLRSREESYPQYLSLGATGPKMRALNALILTDARLRDDEAGNAQLEQLVGSQPPDFWIGLQTTPQ